MGLRLQRQRSRLPQEFPQLDYVNRNPSRLIFAKQLGCRLLAGLILVIDVAQRLTVSVPHNEAVGRNVRSPRRRETGSGIARFNKSKAAKVVCRGPLLGNFLFRHHYKIIEQHLLPPP
jgi:hypothetical protein